jgi:hypothetical protein
LRHFGQVFTLHDPLPQGVGQADAPNDGRQGVSGTGAIIAIKVIPLLPECRRVLPMHERTAVGDTMPDRR